MTSSTQIDVELLDSAASDDANLIDRLTNLVNEVYAVAEDGLWQSGATRTTSEEMSSLVAAGEILVASRPGEGIVGSVRFHDLDPDTSEFGLLVSAHDQRNIGVGRTLLDEVERRSRDRNQQAIQLELLVPVGWRHSNKEFLAAWYGRHGYRQIASASVADSYPYIAQLLATPCELQIHRKELR